jgi:hypothetical protein
MTKRNPNLAKLISGYLFPEIHKRKVAFMEQNPGAKVISLGIGDTTEPIPVSIARGLSEAAQRLGTPKGWSILMPSSSPMDPSATSAVCKSSSGRTPRSPSKTPPTLPMWTPPSSLARRGNMITAALNIAKSSTCPASRKTIFFLL